MPQDNAVDNSTNIEFVVEVMKFSRYGAMAEIFVIEALRRYAFQVTTTDAKLLDRARLPGTALQAVGEEIDAKLAAKYGPYRTIKGRHRPMAVSPQITWS